jgi:glyoxylase I family protein
MIKEIINSPVNLQGMAPLLQVFDMPASLHFYRDILGFEVTTHSPGDGDDVDWVLLKLNNIEVMLNTAYEKPNRPPVPNLTRIKWHNDTTLYFGCPDIDMAYSQLKEKIPGLKKPAITGYGWKALDLDDPDSYHICFHWPLKDDDNNT